MLEWSGSFCAVGRSTMDVALDGSRTWRICKLVVGGCGRGWTAGESIFTKYFRTLGIYWKNFEGHLRILLLSFQFSNIQYFCHILKSFPARNRTPRCDVGESIAGHHSGLTPVQQPRPQLPVRHSGEFRPRATLHTVHS